MSAQAPREAVHPLELRRAVLRKVEPIETHGLNLAARRRMRNAKAVKLMLAARCKADHELDSPQLRADELLTRSSQITKNASSIRRGPKAPASCNPSKNARTCLVTVSATSARVPAATAQRVPCSMLLKMNRASRRADK